MANRRLPREGRKDATKPAHAVPLASARQHLDVETQAGHSSERAVKGPLECGIALGSQSGSFPLTGHQPNRTKLRGQCGSSAGWARPSLELLESAGFWVDSGLSLPALADYDARTGVMP